MEKGFQRGGGGFILEGSFVIYEGVLSIENSITDSRRE